MIKKTLCLIIAACLVLAVPALAADTPALRTSEAGIAFIKDKEGFAATAYEDSLGWAIGYGTRCEPGEYPNGITEAEADALLTSIGFPREIIDRVCWIVGRHHTYTDIQGLDYQILVEADFLVNLYEKDEGVEAQRAAYEKIFRTETGRRLCQEHFPAVCQA